MPTIQYREWEPRTSVSAKAKLRGDTLSDREKVDHAISIVDEYVLQGLRLTARQLYYQFVSRAFIPNTEASYKGFTDLLAKARYAGLIDWEAIEDRGREPVQWSEYESPEHFITSQARGYRLPRWSNQGNYVELWVEKQALAGVLEPLAMEFHVTLMVNKGYSSASAMWESAQRYISKANQEPDGMVDNDDYNDEKDEKGKFLFYLGDHDPSGEDMVRDIGDRLAEFGVRDLLVQKLALTRTQIDQYKPPPNPAKMTDSRAAEYVKKHGRSSWEVDALPPDVLASIIRSAFNAVVDKQKMEAMRAREKVHIEKLKQAARRIRDE